VSPLFKTEGPPSSPDGATDWKRRTGSSLPAPTNLPVSSVSSSSMPRARQTGKIQAVRGPIADFALMTPATRVIEELLAVQWGERLLVVHDGMHEDLGLAFEMAALEKKATAERLTWEANAERPLRACPPAIVEAIRKAAATVLAVTYQDGEYDARYGFVQACAAARTRHVHIVGTSRKAFLASMTTSSGRIFELTESVRRLLRPASKISVRSATGTQLELEMAPHLRWFNNGELVRPGHWVNVPFGSLVSSPASATGVYVADASMGGGVGARAGSLHARPIKLTFEAGKLRSVDCGDPSLRVYVERFVAEAQGHDRLALVSLGTNPGILSPLGEIVHDENMPGLHIALGDPFSARTGATWTAHGQLAFASASTDVDIDGQPLVRRGRFVRFV
jgi:leucyl aminopeptidase (aminopeptidase T)